MRELLTVDGYLIADVTGYYTSMNQSDIHTDDNFLRNIQVIS